MTKETRNNCGYNSKEYLRLNEACKLLEVSASYMYKLTMHKAIPYYKPNGKLIYFKKTDLDKWILKSKIKSDEEIIDELTQQYGI